MEQENTRVLSAFETVLKKMEKNMSDMPKKWEEYEEELKKVRQIVEKNSGEFSKESEKYFKSLLSIIDLLKKGDTREYEGSARILNQFLETIETDIGDKDQSKFIRTQFEKLLNEITSYTSGSKGVYQKLSSTLFGGKKEKPQETAFSEKYGVEKVSPAEIMKIKSAEDKRKDKEHALRDREKDEQKEYENEQSVYQANIIRLLTEIRDNTEGGAKSFERMSLRSDDNRSGPGGPGGSLWDKMKNWAAPALAGMPLGVRLAANVLKFLPKAGKVAASAAGTAARTAAPVVARFGPAGAAIGSAVGAYNDYHNASEIIGKPEKETTTKDRIGAGSSFYDLFGRAASFQIIPDIIQANEKLNKSGKKYEGFGGYFDRAGDIHSILKRDSAIRTSESLSQVEKMKNETKDKFLDFINKPRIAGPIVGPKIDTQIFSKPKEQPKVAPTLAPRKEERKPERFDPAKLIMEHFGKQFNNKEMNAILGNIQKESGGKFGKQESSKYKVSTPEGVARIRDIFKGRLAGYKDEELPDLVKDPKIFFEVVYGKQTEVGKKLGNTEEGDGYKFRGRGLIQLTGKGNYLKASKALYKDERLVKDPDLILKEPEIDLAVSSWYIKDRMAAMIEKTGINPEKATQEEVDRLITSVVAGKVVNKGEKSYHGSLLKKVSSYSATNPTQKLLERTNNISYLEQEKKNETKVVQKEEKPPVMVSSSNVVNNNAMNVPLSPNPINNNRKLFESRYVPA